MKKPRKKKSTISSGVEDHSKTLHVLDVTSVDQIRKFKTITENWYKYYYQYHHLLAFERDRINDKLQDALKISCVRDYPLKEWCRIVQLRYTLELLSAKGSLKSTGGRFNIGDINPQRFPPFPALYLAQDSLTARSEVYGKGKPDKLSFYDYALEKEDSHTFVRINGKLDTVLDLTQPKCLDVYFNLIKDIAFPKYFKKTAKIWGFHVPRTVKNTKELLKTLYEPNWRFWPMQCDVPSNSQIFGQLACYAGIQAIVYQSQRGGKLCATVFPQNFEGTDSFLEIADPTMAP